MRSGRKHRPDSLAGKGAFEIIEETFHLLRGAPVGVLAAYYVGTLPFVLGILYFWADMSRSARAHEDVAKGAFALALLFIWMKAWHTVYARRLWGDVCGHAPPRLTLMRLARIAIRQAVVQTSGLLLLPLALLVMLPFGWTHALYQNMTVLDNGESGDVRGLVRKAAGLAGLWQRQNHVVIWALSPFLMMTAVALYIVIIPVVAAITPDWTSVFLTFYSVLYIFLLMPLSPFGVVIAVNIASAILIAPHLLRTFLGVQTVFVTSPSGMFNSTFFAVVCGLTYLCMDPLMKGAYVLRCFYGESLGTGEDLRVELKRLASRALGILCVVSVLLAASSTAQAQQNPPSSEIQNPKSKIQNRAAALSRALDRELENRRYAWRMPREPIPVEEEGLIAAFMRGVSETIGDWLGVVRQWFEKLLDWVALRGDSPASGGGRGLGGMGGALKLLLYGLLALLLCTAAILLLRTWRQPSALSVQAVADAVDASPDIEDDTTSADQLPADGWLALARELVAKGELRLALRAVFLAGLAHLGKREFIYIARFKSNRDYAQELERRGHARPEVLETFSQSVAIYESVWYGAHQATQELLDCVVANQERLSDAQS